MSICIFRLKIGAQFFIQFLLSKESRQSLQSPGFEKTCVFVYFLKKLSSYFSGCNFMYTFEHWMLRSTFYWCFTNGVPKHPNRRGKVWHSWTAVEKSSHLIRPNRRLVQLSSVDPKFNRRSGLTMIFSAVRYRNSRVSQNARARWNLRCGTYSLKSVINNARTHFICVWK